MNGCGCNRSTGYICRTHEELAEGHALTRDMDRRDA